MDQITMTTSDEGSLLNLLASSSTNDESTGWVDVPNGTNVLLLNETNFQETITGNCCVLVFFYAKWCHACTPLKPAYAEVATALRDTQCHCVMAAVDCTVDFDLAVSHGVDSLPTITFFLNGDPVAEYQGTRTASDLRGFVDRTCDATADDHRLPGNETRKGLHGLVAAIRPKKILKKLKAVKKAIKKKFLRKKNACRK